MALDGQIVTEKEPQMLISLPLRLIIKAQRREKEDPSAKVARSFISISPRFLIENHFRRTQLWRWKRRCAVVQEAGWSNWLSSPFHQKLQEAVDHHKITIWFNLRFASQNFSRRSQQLETGVASPVSQHRCCHLMPLLSFFLIKCYPSIEQLTKQREKEGGGS